MKIAYFHRLTFEDTEQRFKEEAEKMGLEVTFIKYKQLVMENESINKPINQYTNKPLQNTGDELQMTSDELHLKPANRITFGDYDIKDFDIWFIRSVGSELEWSKLLQLYARDYNIPVVDEYILTEGVLKRYKSTMGYILAKNNILYPKTIYFNTFGQVKKHLGIVDSKPVNEVTSQPANDSTPQPINRLTDQLPNGLSFPFIIKLSSGGRHGMSTFFVQKAEDILEIENTLKARREKAQKEGKIVPNYRGFLLQEYIPNDGDYRVMTVGYKCIGGFKRAPKEEKLVLNKSQGKSTGLLELPEDVIKTAEEAGRVLGVEVAGTDLVRSKDTGQIYIVEVNEAPQFKVFEKRTKINAPALILNYLVEKYSKLKIGL